MKTLATILEHKVVAIIRGVEPSALTDVATALFEGGVRLIELTFNSEDPLAGLEKLSTAMSDKICVGAGTVLDTETVKAAVGAGASFILSPIVKPDVVAATCNLGAVSIPGAFTATEIHTAYESGASLVKIFPASIGPAYFRDLKGPFPQIPLMPTGGLNIGNLRGYFEAGAAAAGIGSALVDSSRALSDNYLDEIRIRAKAFVTLVSTV